MRQFRKNSRKALAAFMSVWLSGIIFLFCCDMSAKAAAKDFCPLAKAAPSHCDKGKNNKNSQLVSDDGSAELNCCGLIPAVFDKTRKIERDTNAAQPAEKPAALLRPFGTAPITFGTSDFYTSYHPARDKTFLKHRVFRI